MSVVNVRKPLRDKLGDEAVDSLGAPEPLALTEKLEWNPEKDYWQEPDDPLNKYFKPMIDYGIRKSYEMEQIIPFQDPENVDSDPILDACDF